MPRETFEVELLHFVVSPIGCPTIVRHSIDGGHYPRAMASSLAMHEHRLIGRIVHQLQELRDGSIGRPFRSRHRNSIELHSRALNKSSLICTSVARQVDHGLNAKSR